MIVTPALLERNDIFEGWGGFKYRVVGIESGMMCYKYLSSNRNIGDALYKISIKSKIKLKLIEDGDFGCPPEQLKKHFKILPEISLS